MLHTCIHINGHIIHSHASMHRHATYIYPCSFSLTQACDENIPETKSKPEGKVTIMKPSYVDPFCCLCVSPDIRHETADHISRSVCYSPCNRLAAENLQW